MVGKLRLTFFWGGEGVHETTNHPVTADLQHADGTFQTNHDSDNGDFEDAKAHGAQVKRTISREDEEPARPARRPVSFQP